MSIRLSIIAIVALLASPPAAFADTPTVDQILEKMHAAYASLSTYSDSGMVTTEDKNVGGPTMTEHHSFVTRFKSPKQFFFAYTKDPKVYDERFVIWCGGETFTTWWSASQSTENYPQGQGGNAFAIGELPTSGALLLVPPLLFAAEDLQGPLALTKEATLSGTETIAGHKTYILTAELQESHWSQNTRTTKIWVDADSYLVRKVMQDTPTGLGGNVVQRVTVTFEPVANGALAAGAFTFTPPPVQ
jgi:outer membrane lipoprotein-sorting protein